MTVLKEKLLAAVRAGIKTVLIPMDNKRDLSEIPVTVKNKLNIIAIENANEILKVSLLKSLKPLKNGESGEYKELSSTKVGKGVENTITH